MAPPQIGLSILPVGIPSVPNSKIVRRRGYHKIDTSIWQPRHSFDAIFLAKIEPGHRENLARLRALYKQKAAGVFDLWGAQAASLLSSAACRRLPRLARIPCYECSKSFSAGCQKGQAGSLCSPDRHSRVWANSFILCQWRISLPN